MRVMKTLYAIAFLCLGLSFQTFASEFYLKLNRVGNFQVSVGGQLQTNSTLMYRFFDLYAGNTQVIVTDIQTSSIVFNNYVNLSNNMRTVAELDAYGTMNIIQNIPITVTNWYTTQIVGTVVNNTGGNYGNPPYGGNVYDPAAEASFNEFLAFLDKQSFDSNKLTEAKTYAAKSNLSAQQIKSIALKFTYDSNRLDFAKAAYTNCRDKANYFLLKSAFQFTSSYSELEDYMNTH